MATVKSDDDVRAFLQKLASRAKDRHSGDVWSTLVLVTASPEEVAAVTALMQQPEPRRVAFDAYLNALVCPDCGGSNLHQEETREKAGEVAIGFACEMCNEDGGPLKVLRIAQHKGCTYIEWVSAPVKARK